MTLREEKMFALLKEGYQLMPLGTRKKSNWVCRVGDFFDENRDDKEDENNYSKGLDKRQEEEVD